MKGRSLINYAVLIRCFLNLFFYRAPFAYALRPRMGLLRTPGSDQCIHLPSKLQQFSKPSKMSEKILLGESATSIYDTKDSVPFPC